MTSPTPTPAELLALAERGWRLWRMPAGERVPKNRKEVVMTTLTMREALRPFAKAADNYADVAAKRDDDHFIDADATVSVADLRAARAALAADAAGERRDTRCPACLGRGFVPMARGAKARARFAEPATDDGSCSFCNGTGQVAAAPSPPAAEWRSPADAPSDDPVLVDCRHNFGRQVSVCWKISERWYGGPAEMPGFEVLGWMPIPAPPRSAEGEKG